MFTTKDGKTVRIDAKHLEQHASVLPYLEEVLSQVDMKNSSPVIATVNLGRIVGVTGCVKTTAADTIVYQRREGRPGLSRMVLNRKAEPCDSVTVILRRIGLECELITAFVGYAGLREPGDKTFKSAEDYSAAVDHWLSHALVMEESKMTDEVGTFEDYIKNRFDYVGDLLFV